MKMTETAFTKAMLSTVLLILKCAKIKKSVKKIY